MRPPPSGCASTGRSRRSSPPPVGPGGPPRVARRCRPPPHRPRPARPPGLATEDPAELAEVMSTVFLQFGSFAAAVTDFYTYVGSVLARPDLDDDEWLGFKGLLLDYLETIVDAVARHTGTIRVALDALNPSLPNDHRPLGRRRPRPRTLACLEPGRRRHRTLTWTGDRRLGRAARLVRQRRPPRHRARRSSAPRQHGRSGRCWPTSSG